MKQKCNLSIIIPFYNIDFFEETLKSLANQTNKNFKLYIGNDCSVANPINLISKYFDLEEINYYSYDENLGSTNLALQWQRIFNNITEDWFQILGDDDVLDNNFVQSFYANLKFTDDINVIKFSQCWIDASGTILNTFTTFPKFNKVYDLWLRKADFRTRSSLSEHIFRTSTAKKYPFRQYPLAWPTDDMLIFEVGEFKNIFFIEESRVYVRVSPISISGADDNIQEKYLASCFYYKDIVTEYWRAIPNKDFRFLVLRYLYYSNLAGQNYDEYFIFKKFIAKGIFGGYIKYLINRFCN